MTERDPRDTAAEEREDRDRREDADASDESPTRFVEGMDEDIVISDGEELSAGEHEGEVGSFERTTDDAGEDGHPRLASSHDVTELDAAPGPQTSFDPDGFDADSLVDHGLTLGEAVPGGVKDQLAAGMSDGEIRQWLHDYANGFGIDTAGMNDQQLLGAVEQATRAELGGYDHVDTMPSRSAQQAADDFEMMGGSVTEDAQGNLTFHKATFGSEKGEALSTIPAGTDVDANQATANAALGLAHDALPTEVAKEIARDLINDPSHHLADIESVEVTGDSVIVTFTDGSTKTYQQGEVQDPQSSSTPSEDHSTSGSSSSDGSDDDGDDDDDDDDDDGGGDDEPEAEDEVPDAADSAAGDEGEAGDEGMPSPAEHHVDHEQAVEALLTNPAFAAEREVMIRGLEQQIGGGLIEVDLGSEQALHEFLLSPMGAETLRLMGMAVENQGLGGQTTPTPDDVALSVPDEHSLDNVALQAAGGGAAPPPGGFGSGAPGGDDEEDAPVGGPGPGVGGPGTAEPVVVASLDEQVVALADDHGHAAIGLDDDEDGVEPTVGSTLGDLGDLVE